MNIPNFIDIPVVGKDGKLTNEWRVILQQLFQELQANAGPNGIVVPQRPTSDFAVLTKSVNGTILYDSTTNEFKGRIGVIPSWKTFTLT